MDAHSPKLGSLDSNGTPDAMQRLQHVRAVPAASDAHVASCLPRHPRLMVWLTLQANGLLSAKVEMLRDNLKAARMESADKVKLEEEVTQLKQQLAASQGAGQSGRGIRKGRSVSQDELRSQTQLWMQLVRTQPVTMPRAWCLSATHSYHCHSWSVTGSLHEVVGREAA